MKEKRKKNDSFFLRHLSQRDRWERGNGEKMEVFWFGYDDWSTNVSYQLDGCNTIFKGWSSKFFWQMEESTKKKKKKKDKLTQHYEDNSVGSVDKIKKWNSKFSS